MNPNDKLLADLENQDNEQPQIEPEISQKGSKFTRIIKKLVKTAFFTVVFFAVMFGFFYVSGKVSDKSTMNWLNKIPIIGHIKNLAQSSSTPLDGEERGRVNILLLGVGGKGHDGAHLTDTIIVASLKPKTNELSLLSIPRDLAVPIENMGWRRINNVNAYAEMAEPGSGGIAASQAVSEIIDAPIDYYVKVDFEGFRRIVNHFDGLDIEVENEFDDYRYPILGEEDNPDWESRFMHLHFDAGPQHMDGETALRYARSRHALGVEGTDFARAARQQKVLTALKEKALSAESLLNPALIASVIKELNDHVDTNMQIWEMVKLWNIIKDIDREKIINTVLDNGPNGLLMDSMTEEGAFTLVPRSGNFQEVQYLFENLFTDIPQEKKKQVNEEDATIQVLNGTWINGLAGRMALDLEKYGFDVTYVGNCSKQNFEKTVIYDLTFGEKKNSLKLLKEETGANVAFELPEWLKEDIKMLVEKGEIKSQPDLIIILGRDADRLHTINNLN